MSINCFTAAPCPRRDGVMLLRIASHSCEAVEAKIFTITETLERSHPNGNTRARWSGPTFMGHEYVAHGELFAGGEP